MTQVSVVKLLAAALVLVVNEAAVAVFAEPDGGGASEDSTTHLREARTNHPGPAGASHVLNAPLAWAE